MVIKGTFKKKILRKKTLHEDGNITYSISKKFKNKSFPRTEKWYNMKSEKFKKHALKSNRKRISVFDVHHNYIPKHVNHNHEVFPEIYLLIYRKYNKMPSIENTKNNKME